MRLRDATPADAEAIRLVHAASILGLGPAAYDDDQVEAWAAGCESADYAAAIEAETTEYVVAVGDRGVVGFGSAALEPPESYESDPDAEVTGVYVHPGVARDGVGTRLYEELEARARAAGVVVLGLTASLNAVPFYEARGYERVAERGHEFSAREGTGVTGTVVEMRKEP